MYSVYYVENKLNGMRYVGQTEKSLSDRFYHHCYKKRKRNFNKIITVVGKENFSIHLIEKCETRNEAGRLEAYYIKKYKTLHPEGYNCQTGGIQGYIYSAESKKKMSKAIFLNNPARDRTRTKKTRKKMSESHKGRICSEETKRKISLAQKGKSKIYAMKKIRCLNNNVVYESAQKACEELNISRASITNILNKKLISVKGYGFEYYKE